MSDTPAKRHIRILGGGMGGLSTAFYLTSRPNWQDEYEVTLHQLGWRLGGKCASSRNADAGWRIEEHGIHLFGGFYLNAFAMMDAVFKELGRDPSKPLSTMENAFLPNNCSLGWEYRKGQWSPWPSQLEPNGRKPWEQTGDRGMHDVLPAVIDTFRVELEMLLTKLAGGKHGHWLDLEMKIVLGFLGELGKIFGALGKTSLGREVIHLIGAVGSWAEKHLGGLVEEDEHARRSFITMNLLVTLLRGIIEDDVIEKGFDHLDDVPFAKWLEHHGAADVTLASPLVMGQVGILFAYPRGDSTAPPSVSAGVFLHWVLLMRCYFGSFTWLFAAGTGETLIAPLYEVLSKRGVKFEFFSKVENLRVGPDGDSIEGIDIADQVTLKNPKDGYQPLVTGPDGVVGWPHHPCYDQLVQGEELKKHAQAGDPIDLESWWTPWKPVACRTLERGTDFDEVVLAISIGAFPSICGELIAANSDWADMVANVPAIQTQAIQIWLDDPIEQLADDPPDPKVGILAGANYMNPASDFADYSHTLAFEHWPAKPDPCTVLYFCGAMAEDPEPPPFDDHAYPDRQRARVRWEAAQLFQAGTAPLLPKATVQARQGATGDPVGLDTSLLSVPTTGPKPEGFRRLDAQFYRANIDPTERYVLSPPGSTAHRLAPGDSKFTHLFLAGDWTRNGLNFGSVESTVVSGNQAAHAITGDLQGELKDHGTLPKQK